MRRIDVRTRNTRHWCLVFAEGRPSTLLLRGTHQVYCHVDVVVNNSPGTTWAFQTGQIDDLHHTVDFFSKSNILRAFSHFLRLGSWGQVFVFQRYRTIVRAGWVAQRTTTVRDCLGVCLQFLLSDVRLVSVHQIRQRSHGRLSISYTSLIEEMSILSDMFCLIVPSQSKRILLARY